MTDNKRFIVIDVPYENGEPFLYKKMLDKTTKKEYDNSLKGIDDMCDLSNKLHKENEQSKMMIATLRNIVLENEDLEKENNELKEKNKFILEQIKAFRDDCITYLDFDGASTLNRLLDILGKER